MARGRGARALVPAAGLQYHCCMRSTSLRSCAAAALIAALVAGPWGCSDDGAPQVDGFKPGQDLFPPFPDLGQSCAFTCQGCCMGEKCSPGNVPTACGVGGMQCQTCGTNDTCQNGTCVPPKCDATTCPNGCCSTSGKCEQGTTDDACGTGGVACAKCDTTKSVCTSGSCKPKTSAMYKVILEKGELVKSFSCDTFNKCDLYVELTVGSVQATSKTINENDAPQWNETLLTVQAADVLKKFEAKVMDDDWPFDQKVGDCKPTVKEADLTAGSIKTECGTYSSMGFLKTCYITFKFTAL